MRVFRYQIPATVLSAGSIVTIGSFDGVHRGHQEIFQCMASHARARGLPRVAISFYPHPATVVRGVPALPPMTPLWQKCALLEALGVDLLLLLHFTQAFSKLTAEAFVTRYLEGMLSAKVLVVGADTRLGAGRTGDVDLLTRRARTFGCAVETPPFLLDRGLKIGSRQIRQYLEAGDVRRAAELLGRPFSIRSRVVHGDGRGRTIGVPTANSAPVRQLLPAAGVYCTLADEGAGPTPAVTNVGQRPTFGGGEVRVETHLLEPPKGALYGKPLTLQFCERLRGEQRFSSAEELVVQIRKDIESARSFFQGAA